MKEEYKEILVILVVFVGIFMLAMLIHYYLYNPGNSVKIKGTITVNNLSQDNASINHTLYSNLSGYANMTINSTRFDFNYYAYRPNITTVTGYEFHLNLNRSTMGNWTVRDYKINLISRYISEESNITILNVSRVYKHQSEVPLQDDCLPHKPNTTEYCFVKWKVNITD